MKLIDSNILIYAAKAEASDELRTIVAGSDVFVSEISRLEVLGFQSITPDQKHFFEQLFSLIAILPIDKAVIDKAIELRQVKKMKVGDSIIAATAFLKGLQLVTADQDFNKVTEINIDNPIVPR